MSGLRSALGSGLKGFLRLWDGPVQRARLRWLEEPPVLLAFGLHGVYRDPGEIDGKIALPDQFLALDDLRRMIEYFLEAGFSFVSPDDVLAGLDANGHGVLLSFDDGYFNNVRAFDLLREYNLPGTLAVATGFVAEGKGFWWDVAWREGRRRGVADLEGLLQRWERMPGAARDREIEERFGPAAWIPAGDLDRPLTPDELQELAAQPGVFIANHTARHAPLSLVSAETAAAEIETAQEQLAVWTGSAPRTIAYPNGRYNPDIRRLVREMGFSLILSSDMRHNPAAPDREAGCMEVGRYFHPFRGEIQRRMDAIRADYDFSEEAMKWITGRLP